MSRKGDETSLHRPAGLLPDNRVGGRLPNDGAGNADIGDGRAWMILPQASALVVLSEKAEGEDAGRPLRVLGVVYEPGVVDAQGDWADEEVIAEAAHAFLANGGRLRRMHREDIPRSEAVLAESFLAPTDLNLNGLTVRKGAWVVVVRVFGESLRDEILSGRLTGFSMGGYGWREPASAPGEADITRKDAPTYRITRFIPVELSLVDHPANQRAFVALKTAASGGAEATDRGEAKSRAERAEAVLQPIRELQAGWIYKEQSFQRRSTYTQDF
jgi:hypothetical protein